MKPEAKRRRTANIRFRGVRKRLSGKWLLKLRLPHRRKRIWLGSHDSLEKADQAFDAAACFNFPDQPSDIPAAGTAFWPHSVQAAAALHANGPPPLEHSTAEYSASAMPDSSDGCPAADDRSLGGLVTAANWDADFTAFEDGFVYEFFPLSEPQQPDREEENCCGTLDPYLTLWNF